MNCLACGASARRAAAKFCWTCGRELAADYFPGDSLRASYRQTSLVKSKREDAAPPKRVLVQKNAPTFAVTLAFAFAVYSLVPLLGIVFCLPAVALGALDLARRRAFPHKTRPAQAAIILGASLFVVQVFLWLAVGLIFVV